MQLAGAKKVQQVLSEPGVLEEFLLGDNRPDTGFGTGRGVLTEADVQRVRDTWMGMWPMDESDMGEQGYELAMTQSERFVLKPQREGGGNNIYRKDIPKHLKELDGKVRRLGEPKPMEQYILMELINPPNGIYNWLLKGGDKTPRKAEVVSELGIYGAILYIDGKVILNKKIGSLLRTKGKESDEGGVAIGESVGQFQQRAGLTSSGISSIDSPLLVEEDYTGVKMKSQESDTENEFDPLLGC
jgi:glutathione synthase